MEKKIDVAADYGVTAFLFDWYWYNGKPFIERPLNDAFLKASNRQRLKFALMWANHDWYDFFHAKDGEPLKTHLARLRRCRGRSIASRTT